MDPFAAVVLLAIPFPPPDVHLSDVAAFPPPYLAEWGTRQTVCYQRGAARLQPPLGLGREQAEGWACWKAALENDAHYRWFVWDDVRRLHAASDDDTRLVLLRRLRDWLGHAAYRHGTLPPPVPWGWEDPPPLPPPEVIPLPAAGR